MVPSGKVERKSVLRPDLLGRKLEFHDRESQPHSDTRHQSPAANIPPPQGGSHSGDGAPVRQQD